MRTATHSLFLRVPMGHSIHASVRCFSACRTLDSSIFPMLSFTAEKYLNIVFLEEREDTFIIFEGDSLRARKSFEGGHITLVGMQRLEDVSGKTGRVEPEVRLEQQIDDSVDSPLPRLRQIDSPVCGVSATMTEYR